MIDIDEQFRNLQKYLRKINEMDTSGALVRREIGANGPFVVSRVQFNDVQKQLPQLDDLYREAKELCEDSKKESHASFPSISDFVKEVARYRNAIETALPPVGRCSLGAVYGRGVLLDRDGSGNIRRQKRHFHRGGP